MGVAVVGNEVLCFYPYQTWQEGTTLFFNGRALTLSLEIDALLAEGETEE